MSIEIFQDYSKTFIQSFFHNYFKATVDYYLRNAQNFSLHKRQYII